MFELAGEIRRLILLVVHLSQAVMFVEVVVVVTFGAFGAHWCYSRRCLPLGRTCAPSHLRLTSSHLVTRYLFSSSCLDIGKNCTGFALTSYVLPPRRRVRWTYTFFTMVRYLTAVCTHSLRFADIVVFPSRIACVFPSSPPYTAYSPTPRPGPSCPPFPSAFFLPPPALRCVVSGLKPTVGVAVYFFSLFSKAQAQLFAVAAAVSGKDYWCLLKSGTSSDRLRGPADADLNGTTTQRHGGGGMSNTRGGDGEDLQDQCDYPDAADSVHVPPSLRAVVIAVLFANRLAACARGASAARDAFCSNGGGRGRGEVAEACLERQRRQQGGGGAGGQKDTRYMVRA